ncbi:hypothetical protein ABZX30_21290 [Streptomyces sp. NPDC004542]|uniref:hypothetical protein n=1 Tax=Streptomyces sp. NPDC004542 TaxID=3154281 RepID=UPI0033BB91A0
MSCGAGARQPPPLRSASGAWIKRYAAEHELFPYDATGDQFFDVDKFNAYTALGYHVGKAVVEAEQDKGSLDTQKSTSPIPFAVTKRPGV